MTNEKAKKILDNLARKVVLYEGEVLGLSAVIVCKHVGLKFKDIRQYSTRQYSTDTPKFTIDVLNAYLKENRYTETFFVSTYKDALDKMLELSKKGFDIVIGISSHIFNIGIAVADVLFYVFLYLVEEPPVVL